MNAPFFGCCGWAASSIVPTKRYKSYTRQLFDDFSHLESHESESIACILKDEDWPLDLKHTSLVKKTVEYVKYNNDKLPKLVRKLLARAKRGINRRDVKYTSVAVVLLKKIAREANTAVQMHYYLKCFVELIELLLHSYSSVNNYQGLSLLNLVLEQPPFGLDNSGVIHYEQVFRFFEVVKSLESEYKVRFQLHPDKRRQTNLLIVRNCYLYLGHLLGLAHRFKAHLPEEDALLGFCSETIGQNLLKEEEEMLLKALRDFEDEFSLPKSYATMSDSFFGIFSEVNTAKKVSKNLIDNFLKNNAFSRQDSVESVVTTLANRISDSKGDVGYFNETLLESCSRLYSLDLVQANQLAHFIFSRQGIDLSLDESARAFEQWLYLQLALVHEDDKELKAQTARDLELKFTSSDKNSKIMLRYLCALENWCSSEKISNKKLESVLEELKELGVELDYNVFTFDITRIVLKEKPIQHKDLTVCPYESQIMLEEMLLALGSGTI